MSFLRVNFLTMAVCACSIKHGSLNPVKLLSFPCEPNKFDPIQAILFQCLLRWFQRGWLKLDEHFKFSKKGVLIEWRSKKKIDHFVFTTFNYKVGGKYIGPYESSKKTADSLLIYDFQRPT